MTRSVYAAFDRYPSAKGAATHIEHAVAALFSHAEANPGALWVLDPGDEKSDRGTEETRVSPRPDGQCFAVDARAPRLLERAEIFAASLSEWLGQQPEKTLTIGQFRDPWGGVPMIASGKFSRLVYEVNGLPSIEMPYRYPHLVEAVLEKMRRHEGRCLKQADVIVTPSRQTLRHLVSERGVPAKKITVIPNGAEISPPRDRPDDAPEGRYLLYFGALQPWQGIQTLLHAFAQLSDLSDLHLVICSSHKEKQAGPYRRLSGKLGLEGRIAWRHQLPRPELRAWIQHAAVTLAPLTDTPRNTVQGCCPLKILESLAGATPVVASDLPVVRDLVGHFNEGSNQGARAETCGILPVRPERPSEWAIAIRKQLEDPRETGELGRRGRECIRERLTWERHRAQLDRVYSSLLA